MKERTTFVAYELFSFVLICIILYITAENFDETEIAAIGAIGCVKFGIVWDKLRILEHVKRKYFEKCLQTRE